MDVLSPATSSTSTSSSYSIDQPLRFQCSVMANNKGPASTASSAAQPKHAATGEPAICHYRASATGPTPHLQQIHFSAPPTASASDIRRQPPRLTKTPKVSCDSAVATTPTPSATPPPATVRTKSPNIPATAAPTACNPFVPFVSTTAAGSCDAPRPVRQRSIRRRATPSPSLPPPTSSPPPPPAAAAATRTTSIPIDAPAKSGITRSHTISPMRSEQMHTYYMGQHRASCSPTGSTGNNTGTASAGNSRQPSPAAISTSPRHPADVRRQSISCHLPLQQQQQHVIHVPTPISLATAKISSLACPQPAAQLLATALQPATDGNINAASGCSAFAATNPFGTLFRCSTATADATGELGGWSAPNSGISSADAVPLVARPVSVLPQQFPVIVTVSPTAVLLADATSAATPASSFTTSAAAAHARRPSKCGHHPAASPKAPQQHQQHQQHQQVPFIQQPQLHHHHTQHHPPAHYNHQSPGHSHQPHHHLTSTNSTTPSSGHGACGGGGGRVGVAASPTTPPPAPPPPPPSPKSLGASSATSAAAAVAAAVTMPPPQMPTVVQTRPPSPPPSPTPPPPPPALGAVTVATSAAAVVNSQTAGTTSGSSSIQAELNKREEFLKATMKICLVVSPPSNKLLQLKSKSLNHLDNLESHIGTQTECALLSPKPVDYLEVEPSKLCCRLSSSSPPSVASSALSSASSLRKRIPSFRSKKKKPILSRSEVSSSEYFCVFYDVESGAKEREEFVPAVKGTTLGEALNGALLQRNLSFSQITISDNNFPSSMDLGSPPYAGGVNQYTDVGNLAGKFLIVTEKEKPKRAGHALQKAASFGARQRPAKLFQSASTEDPNNPAADSEIGGSGSAAYSSTRLSASQLFPKHSKQRWTGLFGLRNPQQNQLYELLNSYTKFGVPQSVPVAFNFEHEDLAGALELLESVPATWKEFVGAAVAERLTDDQYQTQMAIWELVTTEVAYIHALQTVTDLFLACLEAIQSEHILTDVDQHKLFSNIREICETNIRFWTLYLYPMVTHSRAAGRPMCIEYAQPAFLTFDRLFAPYEKYCAEQSTCQFYCKELHGNNTLFQAYLAWCEGQKLCNRLRLADILVQPMQRLTKYSLLLRAIKKHICGTDETALINMKAMTCSVDDFVVSVNSHLTDRQKNERIKGIMARIESYDVVDSNNETLDKLVKEYSAMFDLCAPMKGCAPTDSRNLFMEGDLKFKDNTGKADVHCFLLTDMLLVCKTIAKKGLGTLKVIRQPFFTDRIVIKAKEHTLYAVYLNEFGLPVTAFTLQCPEAQNWHEAINKTKLLYAEMKQNAGSATSWDDGYNIKYDLSGCEIIGGAGGGSIIGGVCGVGGGIPRSKSPMNSSIGSRISSLNNSHSFSYSGSVELTESKAVSVDFEKANSLSSDEGVASGGGGPAGSGAIYGGKKAPQNSPTKLKAMLASGASVAITANTLNVQSTLSMGQSMPNLNLNSPHTSHNTLLVPGSGSGHSNLLSPSHRGISYPPPSPTRATLRRGFAFSASIKNPPLVKSRNVISQNSFQATGNVMHTASGCGANVLASSSSSSLSAGHVAPAPSPQLPMMVSTGSRCTSPATVQQHYQQQHQQHLLHQHQQQQQQQLQQQHQQQQRTAATTATTEAATSTDIEQQINNSHESDV